MPRRILYLALVLVALGVAFGFGLAFGRLRFPQKPVQQDAILYYQDPMHPSYRSNKPGIAPDCGMQLVPVYAEDAAKSLLVSDTGAAHPLKIDSATQQLYGIRVTRVETSSGPGSRPGSIRVLGRVAADETRIYRLNLGAAGFVRETHDDTVGSHVQKDQRLAVVCPECIQQTGRMRSFAGDKKRINVREGCGKVRCDLVPTCYTAGGNMRNSLVGEGLQPTIILRVIEWLVPPREGNKSLWKLGDDAGKLYHDVGIGHHGLTARLKQACDRIQLADK